MKRKNILFPLVAAVMLSACATIVSGTQQNIFIDTPHVTGAECKLSDSKNGSWYLPDTPGSVNVIKGNGPMNIVCTRQGYETTTVSVSEDVSGATLGNIILGGGIGVFVDAASGAAQKYPDKVIVWLKPRNFSSAKERASWENDKAEYDRKVAEELAAKQKAQSQPAGNRSH
jgi:hypothetical protein